MTDHIRTLQLLGYLGLDRTPIDSEVKAAAQTFQRDQLLSPDGKIGPKTGGRLDFYAHALERTSSHFRQCRRFRITRYVCHVEAGGPGATVPVYDRNREVLTRMTGRDFATAALQGTVLCKNGRLLNVAGKRVPVAHDDYASVLVVAKTFRKLEFAGIRVNGEGRVYEAAAFGWVPASRRGLGYGVGKLGVPYTPFRTAASDIGAYADSAPGFRGKGGLVPAGTKMWWPGMVDAILPDGTTHDGAITANDTGGAIAGQHFDLFCGPAMHVAQVPLRPIEPIWFPGIEERIPRDATYGLVPT